MEKTPFIYSRPDEGPGAGVGLARSGGIERVRRLHRDIVRETAIISCNEVRNYWPEIRDLRNIA
jgi:hypothetical protein